MESVINVVVLLSEQPWLSVIVRQGGGETRLKGMSGERDLNNVEFFPLQSYDTLPALLKMADCHLVVQRHGTADAVLSSKLANVLAIGDNAAITVEPETELGQSCGVHPGIAVCVEPKSVSVLVGGIQQALTIPKTNTVVCEYTRRTLDKENVLNQFIADIRGT